jgi:predicted NAD/FAD-binding protein
VAAGAALQALKWRRWQLAEDITVARWLQAQRQSDWLVEQFWRPMVLSALNTPLELASMQILATTLRDSLGGSRADSDLLLPRLDLSELFPARPCAGCVLAVLQWQPGSRVSSIVPSADGVLVDGAFDAAIVAVAPYHAGALLQDGTADAGQGFPLLADIYRISALRRRYQHAVAHAGFAGRHAGLAV